MMFREILEEVVENAGGGVAAARAGIRMVMPPRSSEVSLTPFKRLSSRTEQACDLATSSRVSPKRKTNDWTLSVARA